MHSGIPTVTIFRPERHRCMSYVHTAGHPDSATEPDYRNYGYYSGRFRRKPARILTDLKSLYPKMTTKMKAALIFKAGELYDLG